MIDDGKYYHSNLNGVYKRIIKEELEETREEVSERII